MGFGAFAALHPLDEHRLLAASTDSIGTKPMVARPRGLLRNCGADMAAHCINDVITCGADPLMLLDYIAAARIELEGAGESFATRYLGPDGQLLAALAANRPAEVAASIRDATGAALKALQNVAGR